MKILFVSNYFPPEVNAPANRTSDHARIWMESGCGVEILTAVPNFPEGVVYPGYRNRLTIEHQHGARVLRVPIYATPNRGTIRRALSYLSFMVSAVWNSHRLEALPTVVAATSPQIFAGLAGWRISRRLGVPFVLEVRDIWPDSIVAVGGLRDGPSIRALRRLERFLYRAADHIVVVTDAFTRDLERKGVSSAKISVVKNGVDLSTLEYPDPVRREATRHQLGVGASFVASYLGTLGMAHRADILIDAAHIAADSGTPGDENLVFLVAGHGSERTAIEARLRDRPAHNVIFLEKQTRERAVQLLGASDASVIHLRAREDFKQVIPSKMFEAMALGIPIVLGVDGEARAILEESKAGDFFTPEDPHALLDALRKLRSDPEVRAGRQAAGPPFVRRHFDRSMLARRYLEILERVVEQAWDGPVREESAI